MALLNAWKTEDRSRPYLSSEQRRKYRKDLGLGEYHPTRYKCHGCGWTTDDGGDDNKNLRLCSGCCQVHFCGSDCMRAHWKQHKPQCLALQRNNNILQLPAHLYPDFLADIKKKFFYVAAPGTTVDMPLVTIVVNDENEPYELLTDADVVFQDSDEVFVV